MGKGHKDNHKARLKRGAIAFKKKAERRKPKRRCVRCGRISRKTLCTPCKEIIGEVST